jgi:hypothetical protein
MKKWGILSLAVIVVTGGCSSGGLAGGRGGGDIQKTFFDRTIVFTVDPGAKEYMTRMENMLAATKKTQDPLTDEEIMPLYRDADMNRDHHITTQEAKTFCQEYTLKFEDAVGRVRGRSAPQQENKGQ